MEAREICLMMDASEGVQYHLAEPKGAKPVSFDYQKCGSLLKKNRIYYSYDQSHNLTKLLVGFFNYFISLYPILF
jgi:hypothetical protein